MIKLGERPPIDEGIWQYPKLGHRRQGYYQGYLLDGNQSNSGTGFLRARPAGSLLRTTTPGQARVTGSAASEYYRTTSRTLLGDDAFRIDATKLVSAYHLNGVR
jgi:hypothetical protein